ncbi:MAG: energy transducer TonB [Chitinophagaceae bacterium]|nr:energy transducer TonB [Chitinophagaceae bacterium]
MSINISDNKTTGEMDAIDKEGYYTNVYPSYPGGDKALVNFFEKNIQYPSNASENGVEGTVKISFTVDENGKISLPKTTTPTIGYGLEEEAVRVFKKMPNWKAGSLKGKNVKTRYTLPVRFQLEG